MICSLTFNSQSEETMVKKKTSETFDICDLLKSNTFDAITTKILPEEAKETTKRKAWSTGIGVA